MPRNGSGVYSADWVNAAPNTTIESAKQNAMIADFVADANAARPITAGGTAGTTAVEGIDNLSTKGANIASAATTDIGAATGRFVHITGTTSITSFGTKTAGVERELVFDGALTLTHNATSLILPGGANITTAAGDTATMVSEGSGNWRCIAYQRAAAIPLVYQTGTWTPTLTCGTSGTISLSAVSMQYTKIGRQVSVAGLLTVSSVSSPVGSLALGGLPFTNGSGDGFIAAVSLRVDNYNAGAARVFEAYVASNQASIVIDVYNTNTGLIEASPAAFFKAGTLLAIQATYFAA